MRTIKYTLLTSSILFSFGVAATNNIDSMIDTSEVSGGELQSFINSFILDNADPRENFDSGSSDDLGFGTEDTALKVPSKHQKKSGSWRDGVVAETSASPPANTALQNQAGEWRDGVNAETSSSRPANTTSQGRYGNWKNETRQEANYIKGADGLFLSNIPETSKLMFNKEFKLLPYDSVMYFNDGVRVEKNPMSDYESNPKLLSYCMLRFSDYGIGRKIDKGKEFIITEISEASEEKSFDVYGKVLAQKVVYTIDNPHLQKMVCFSTEKNSPLTIGDIYYETGASVGIKLRDYISI